MLVENWECDNGPKEKNDKLKIFILKVKIVHMKDVFIDNMNFKLSKN